MKQKGHCKSDADSECERSCPVRYQSSAFYRPCNIAFSSPFLTDMFGLAMIIRMLHEAL